MKTFVSTLKKIIDFVLKYDFFLENLKQILKNDIYYKKIDFFFFQKI